MMLDMGLHATRLKLWSTMTVLLAFQHGHLLYTASSGFPPSIAAPPPTVRACLPGLTRQSRGYSRPSLLAYLTQ
jgi:hypothetical protein